MKHITFLAIAVCLVFSSPALSALDGRDLSLYEGQEAQLVRNFIDTVNRNLPFNLRDVAFEEFEVFILPVFRDLVETGFPISDSFVRDLSDDPAAFYILLASQMAEKNADSEQSLAETEVKHHLRRLAKRVRSQSNRNWVRYIEGKIAAVLMPRYTTDRVQSIEGFMALGKNGGGEFDGQVLKGLPALIYNCSRRLTKK